MKRDAPQRASLSRPSRNGARVQLGGRMAGEAAAVAALSAEMHTLAQGRTQRVNADPQQVERGLAKLVLGLIDLLRQLLERQALRRMEGGSLAGEEIERMGETFMKLEGRMEDLKATFGLTDEDLHLNVGPLQDLA